MRFAGIDYGLARTGLAVSDPEGRVAFPLATFHLEDFTGRSALLDALADRIREEGAGAVVMGLPLLLDGGESLTTRQVRNVTARLKRRLELPIYYMPELLSSEEAAQDLREAGLSREKARAVLDRQAAARILASFLAEPEERRRLA
ncbi:MULTISPECIES: Holliday junction resolvase RuvX [unclassified Desulfovibrio]|uniref:Holliday junction resolvase RuvX n=1 Tax=unclassified Desulfovibrio TaxID=2593640 RepID=UPI0013EDA4BA|nr:MULTISPECIES: Holliday junction resolvase RuvX [unclassified Desulfovibrio]